jgi:hypothetical protein
VPDPIEVPTECSRCAQKVVCVNYWCWGFDAEKYLIGAICVNGSCKKRYVLFPDGRLWITRREFLVLDAVGSAFTAEVLDVGPNDPLNPKAKPKPLCRYSGCESTETERHHIVPKEYAEDEAAWPLVTLCGSHYKKWRSLLTSGLVPGEQE